MRRMLFVCEVACLAAVLAAGDRSVFASKISAQKKTKHITVSAERPLWRVDLQSFGFPTDSSQFQLRRGLDKFNTVDFLSETLIAATFLTREAVPDLQRRDDPNRARPYKLHAVFIELATGNVLKTMDWPIDNQFAGIFSRFDGSFLFFSTDHIVLYSADWRELKEFPLPQLRDYFNALGGIAQSPSGKSLVVQFHRGNSTLCLRIHTDTLDSSEGPCEILELFTASDDGVAAAKDLPGGNSGELGPSGVIVEYGGSMPGPPSSPRTGIQNPDHGNT
ncbi:MAG: hypothetical protein WAM91_12035, partial [Candidatus Acidiferrales bacterium]